MSAAQRPDFHVYTAAMEVDSPLSTIVRMVGSSTEQDVQKNRMEKSAIEDMCDPALVGMTIFLNHSYDIPQDVYGSLLEVPQAKRKDGFIDVHLVADTDMRNPPAVQVLQQIKDGRKHGCSIGCMVDEWEFIEDENGEKSFFSPISIKHVKPVEWSIVGIPANRRSWVQNAIYGVFTRSFSEGNYDEAYKLAPTMKSLFSHDYERLTLSLANKVERDRFDAVSPRPTSTHQLFWEPSRRTFVMHNMATGQKIDADREMVLALLTAEADDQDAAKKAQEARSHKYHIGIKEGGNVTKPSKWSSVPDSEWGDPVNYRYPMPDKAHADNAASRWGDASNRSQYTSEEQSIIGGRIKRRQAHFGSDTSDEKKEQSMNPVTLIEDNGVWYVQNADGTRTPWNTVMAHVQVDENGSHEPTTGHHTHPHSDMHEGLHDHHHAHNNDNMHAHAHDVHMGGENDGDADDTTQKATAPTHTPAMSTPASSVDTASRETLLASYYALGAALGLTSNAHAADSTAPTTEVVTQILERLAQLRDEVVQIHQQVHLALAFAPDLLATGKKISGENLQHAQRAHDALVAMTDGKVCPGMDEEEGEPVDTAVQQAQQQQSMKPLMQSVDMTVLQAEITTVREQLVQAQAQYATLAQQYETLRGRGMGRPTAFTERTVPPALLGSSVSIEAQTPDELKKGTTITRRLDGVWCRKWPAGHGVHQRPELTTAQMSIMTNIDVRTYYDGGEVLVPHFPETDNN